MMTNKKMGLKGIGVAAVVAAMLGAGSANAFSTSDEPAAIVVYPKIVADEVGTCLATGEPCAANGQCGGQDVCQRKDTLIRLGNVSDRLVAAHCFYMNANSHCAADGSVCTTAADCGYLSACLPDWAEIDFDVRITARQPLGWTALEGLGRSGLPLRENAGTNVPPVPETPFIGELRCVEVDPDSNDRLPLVCGAACTGQPTCPACANDLIGQAVIQSVTLGVDYPTDDAADYNAVGLQALETNDGNGYLALGDPASPVGATNEYAPCPSVLVLNHLFDGAVDMVEPTLVTQSSLTLVPCGLDIYTQTCRSITAQFLVYNEFEQRMSTSRQVNCYLDTRLSSIDTSQPTRSIFSAGVAGTVAGQTRIQGVNGGLIGVASLSNAADSLVAQTRLPNAVPPNATGGYGLNQFAERGAAGAGDALVIP